MLTSHTNKVISGIDFAVFLFIVDSLKMFFERRDGEREKKKYVHESTITSLHNAKMLSVTKQCSSTGLKYCDFLGFSSLENSRSFVTSVCVPCLIV